MQSCCGAFDPARVACRSGGYCLGVTSLLDWMNRLADRTETGTSALYVLYVIIAVLVIIVLLKFLGVI